MSDPRRVFITGTSAGFGYDATKALAERGHTVYATMRGVDGKNSNKAHDLEGWANDGGHSVQVLDLDVTDESSVSKAVAAAVEMGGIDVLINNAGAGVLGIDAGFSIEQAQQIFDINLFGMMRVNRAVVPQFSEAGTGLIVYVSSAFGRIAFPFIAIYSASKFAVEGFAESASYELAPQGIESVIVQPFNYATAFLEKSVQPQSDVANTYGSTAKMFEAFITAIEESVKAGGINDPSEVVEVLVEEVERPAGNRPLRRPVGQPVMEMVGAINQTSNQVQGQLLSAFGLK